jgi:hypothetical protein
MVYCDVPFDKEVFQGFVHLGIYVFGHHESSVLNVKDFLVGNLGFVLRHRLVQQDHRSITIV